MKNKYYILRHGQTIHQTKKRGIVYYWPDDSPPVRLTKKGKEQIEKATKILKNKKIDLIFSSDIFRTRQTAGIVAKELGLQVKYDKRLRDINWGIFQGKKSKEAWAYYSNPKEKFYKAPPLGENWNECKKRMLNVLKEIEKKYKNKTILIISHGDPLWLLEGAVKKIKKDELLKQKVSDNYIKVGEIRKL